MNLTYKKLLEKAVSQQHATKEFFKKLKQVRPHDLDQQCNQLHHKAFGHIDCLQCGNCCATTGPMLLPRDIEQLARTQGMKQQQFANTFLRKDEDGDMVFKHLPCPFLEADNCCHVYDNRPKACREYPHTQQKKIIQKLDITYHNSLICPAVAEVVEGLKKVYPL